MTHPTHAAQRDASFCNKPGRGGKFHVIVGDGVPACSTATLWHEARIILIRDTRIPLRDVYDVLRCQRNGCRQRWPAGPGRP